MTKIIFGFSLIETCDRYPNGITNSYNVIMTSNNDSNNDKNM